MDIADALRKLAEALKMPGVAKAPKMPEPLKNPGEATQKLKGMSNPVSFRAPKVP